MIKWTFDKNDLQYEGNFNIGELWTIEQLAEYEAEQERKAIKEAGIETPRGYIVWKKKHYNF